MDTVRRKTRYAGQQDASWASKEMRSLLLAKVSVLARWEMKRPSMAHTGFFVLIARPKASTFTFRTAAATWAI